MKKFVYYGLLFIIIAIVLALVAGYLLNSKVGGSVSSTNVTANAGSFAYVQIPGGNYTALALYMVLANNTNMYVMNSSTFSEWSGYLGANSSASGLSRARALGLSGNYTFVDKRSVYTQLFTGNGSSSSMNGAYVVIDNTPGSNSSKIAVSGIVTYIPIKLSSLLVYEAPVILAIILAIAGLIVIICILGAASFPVFAWFFVTGPRPPFFFAVQCIVALLIVVRHHANIRRLLAGTETRIGAKDQA